MKVAIIIDNSDSKDGGGYVFQDSLVRKFIEHSTDSKHNYIIFCHKKILNKYQDLLDKYNLNYEIYNSDGLIKNINIKILKYFPYLNNFIKLKGNLHSKMLKLKIEFVWKISPGGESFDIPYIAMVWDLMHLTHPWFPEVSSNRIWNKRELEITEFLKRSSKIITGTLAGKKEIQNFYQIPSERIEVVAHPTPDFSLPAMKHDIDIHDKYKIKGKILFYPAQFWPHKNHLILLKVLQSLIKKGNNEFCLVFSGSDHSNKKYVETLVKNYNLSEKVFFLGFIPVEDMIVIYKNAFALIYPSYCGPENLPPLEAFHLGCPVIASKIDGSIEQLGNAALLAEPNDTEHFVKHIEDLLYDRDLRLSLIERGYVRAKKNKTEDFIKKILLIMDRFESIRKSWR